MVDMDVDEVGSAVGVPAQVDGDARELEMGMLACDGIWAVDGVGLTASRNCWSSADMVDG